MITLYRRQEETQPDTTRIKPHRDTLRQPQAFDWWSFLYRQARLPEGRMT